MQKFNRNLAYLIGYMLILMTFIVIIQAFFRYVLGSSLTWGEELARYLMVWIAFLGSAIGIQQGELASLTFIRDKLPKKLWKFAIINCAILLLVFQIVLFVVGIQYVMNNIAQTTPSLNIPYYIPYSVIPISALLMMGYTVETYYNELFSRN